MPEESCVLVVDDDSMVRLLVGRALERAGCMVVNASDGAQALEILERGGIGIDLVLTDISMPRLGGLELGRRIARMTPPMPVLYMSSQLTDAFLDRGAALTLAPFLLKPFSIGSLVAAVIGLLASSSAYRGAAEWPLDVPTHERSPAAAALSEPADGAEGTEGCGMAGWLQ